VRRHEIWSSKTYSGRPPGKLTRDLDFGFVLSDWKQFENLKATLISTGQFKADPVIQSARESWT